MWHADRFGNRPKMIGPGWVILCVHKYGSSMSASNKGLWQECLRCKRWIKTIDLETPRRELERMVAANAQRT